MQKQIGSVMFIETRFVNDKQLTGHLLATFKFEYLYLKLCDSVFIAVEQILSLDIGKASVIVRTCLPQGFSWTTEKSL